MAIKNVYLFDLGFRNFDHHAILQIIILALSYSVDPASLKQSGHTWLGEHITDTYITETDTTELENLGHNIIDIFIIKT